MKQLLLILFLLLFTACGTKKFYTLGNNMHIKTKENFNKSIDVLKVKVPKYLHEHKIVRQVSPYQIEFIDKANWLIPMEKKLTQMLIEYLQQSMNNPNIHLYPWDSNNNTNIRISIDIQKFIASKDSVALKANYKVMYLKSKTSKMKSFEIQLPTNASIENMMSVMEEVYTLLIEQIKTTILNNK